MRHLLALSVAIATVATASASHAETCCRSVPSWYIGLGGGAVFLDDADINVTGTSFLGNLATDYDAGFGMQATFGYRISPYFRAETEFSYRSNTLNTVNGVDPGNFLSGGSGHPEQTVKAFMANGYFDLDNRSYFTPYVGAGAGIADLDTGTSLSAGTETHKLKDWVLAYQFMGGVAYGAGGNDPKFPFELYLEYRYFTTEDGEVEYPSVAGGYVRSFSHTSQNIMIGGRMYLF